MDAKIVQSATGHGVQLDWQEATPGTSFEIYRSDTAGGEDYNSAPLAVVDVNVFTYTDTQVVEGDTYYYTALSVLNGVKSDPSNEASATLPTKPASPSNLTAKSL